MDKADLKKWDRYKASSLKTFNTRWVKTYDSCIWFKIWSAERWDRTVIDHLAGNIDSVHVLDVGCASGRLLESLANAGVRKLAGAELAPGILEAARKRMQSMGTGADLKTADAEDNLPWRDGTFDVITLTGVLHHFYRPSDALGEMRRVLRNGGSLIILEPWFVPPFRQIVNAYLRVFPAYGDCHFYSPSGVTKLLEDSGFQKVNYERVDWLTFLIKGEKTP